ncbi:DUF3541 domain-containing protein [Fodinicurvata sediminis]|uniref:DUF3541 domain-containing protein n=1 Tax=Fodinicurvata sediminis TaxID=1121832 RepID=UPI000411B261|nr:DUF3541 domain-containing protein [Fodinicurvata sediminis]
MQIRPSGGSGQALRILTAILAFSLLLFASYAGAGSPANCDKMGQEIRTRYDAHLEGFSISKQRHYAQRLYRITGNKDYLHGNLRYARRLLGRLRVDIAGLKLPGYALMQSRKVVEDYASRTEKQRARKEMLGTWGEIAYAKNLAFRLVQAKYHGLLHEAFLPDYQRALSYLASVDFRAFLSDPEVLRVYAPQVANQLYYLHELGVSDLRGPVLAAFRDLYPPARDGALSRAEYRNKIYGMTHFVIAASRYYQQPVQRQEFDWILAYFEENLEVILRRTKEDIYTEVALSFLLAGEEKHAAVERIRQALREVYDPEAAMIPSETGETGDLAAGEHRNVLAVMLFCWPEQLHVGPDLSDLVSRRVQ